MCEKGDKYNNGQQIGRNWIKKKKKANHPNDMHNLWVVKNLAKGEAVPFSFHIVYFVVESQ